MLSLVHPTKIHVYTQPADMRKGVNGLSGIIRSVRRRECLPLMKHLEVLLESLAAQRLFPRAHLGWRSVKCFQPWTS